MGPLQAVLFVEPRVIAVLMEAEFPLCKSRMMACLWYGYDGSNHSVFILMPERDSGIVMVANASGFERKPQINQIAEGIISLLNGKSPASVVAPSIYRFLYWAILLRSLLMLVGIFYSWRRWRDKGAGYQLLVVSLHGGVASLWLSAMPLVIG